MSKQCIALALIATLSSAAGADPVADIWKSKCKSCHGDDGKGDTKTGRKEKVADMTQPDWQKQHTDAEIREVIADGSKEKSKMKPYKDKLSAAEIDGLVKYIRALKP